MFSFVVQEAMRPMVTEYPLVSVDVEATGTNPFVHDLLAIALAPLDEEAEPLTAYVRVEDPTWTPFAKENFQRFADDWTREALPPEQVLEALEGYLENVGGAQSVTLVGHNVGFDMAFLRKLAASCGRDGIRGLSHRTLDSHTLLYAAWLRGEVPPEALSSDGAFAHFGIDVPGRIRHTALYDALATRELFMRLLPVLRRGTRRVEVVRDRTLPPREEG
jgi:DNA polymerase III epsilon subunit-like protein